MRPTLGGYVWGRVNRGRQPELCEPLGDGGEGEVQQASLWGERPPGNANLRECCRYLGLRARTDCGPWRASPACFFTDLGTADPRAIITVVAAGIVTVFQYLECGEHIPRRNATGLERGERPKGVMLREIVLVGVDEPFPPVCAPCTEQQDERQWPEE